MSQIYLFCAAVGIPMLIWFAFVGDDGDGFGDADADGALVAISLSTISFVVGFFGLAGLLFEASGLSGIIVTPLALLAGIGAGGLSSRVMRWVRDNSTSSDVPDSALQGTVAKVAMRVSAEHRGKIVVIKGGAREQMTATPVDGSSIDVGQEVVIVGVERGVALVAPMQTLPEIE